MSRTDVDTEARDVALGSRTLRIGTRASLLARTQSGHIAAALRRSGLAVELVEIPTEGDLSVEPLTSLGGTGVFVGALRTALSQGRIDLAVHSLKDLPTADAPGLTVAAVPAREDPRDVLVARDSLTLGELLPGDRVGTGSPRRASQLHALGLGLQVEEIRGNVDTRLSRVHSGDLDGVLLARAGLARLGRLDEVTETLDPLQMLPAPGQGALAVEVRTRDAELLAWVREELDDPASRAATTAERDLLGVLEAGCSAPVGALCEVAEGEDGEELWLRAVVLSTDGALSVRRSGSGPLSDPARLGREVAAELLADGAADLMDRVSPAGAATSGRAEGGPWSGVPPHGPDP